MKIDFIYERIVKIVFSNTARTKKDNVPLWRKKRQITKIMSRVTLS